MTVVIIKTSDEKRVVRANRLSNVAERRVPALG